MAVFWICFPRKKTHERALLLLKKQQNRIFIWNQEGFILLRPWGWNGFLLEKFLSPKPTKSGNKPSFKWTPPHLQVIRFLVAFTGHEISPNVWIQNVVFRGYKLAFRFLLPPNFVLSDVPATPNKRAPLLASRHQLLSWGRSLPQN